MSKYPGLGPYVLEGISDDDFGKSYSGSQISKKNQRKRKQLMKQSRKH